MDINLVCAKHPRVQLGGDWRRGEFEVEPCEECLEEARSKGYDAGKEDAELEIEE